MDSDGDGIGDLPGITRQLDYIASLGVDAVWISPIFESPMKDFGYDVSDYRNVDALFGTLADFDRLIARAHQLGLKVMIDQVLSHSSDQHPWFKESRSSRNNPRADWYVWADARADGSPPSNWLSVFGGSSWTWDARRKQYYLHNFLAEQPDLNYHNPAVQDQVLDDIRFWLDRGVDGFRFDTSNYFHHDPELRDNPPLHQAWQPSQLPANPYEMQRHLYDKNRPENTAFFERVRALLDEYGAASVGEVGDAEALDLMIDYTRGGKRLHMTYSFAFLNPQGHAEHVRRHADEFEQAAAAGATGSWPCWTIGNHDSVRVMSRWGGGQAPQDFVRMAMAMLFSLRGSACWYQGDELGLPEAELAFEDLVDPPGIAFWPEYKGRDGCRTPMPWRNDQPQAGFSSGADVKPWLPVVAEHRALAVEHCERDPGSPLHFMRDFLAWRKEHSVLMTGEVQYLAGSHEVLALLRCPAAGVQESALYCCFNFSSVPQDVTTGLSLSPLAIPGLPAHQQGRLDGNRLELPAYGIFFAALNG